MSARNPNFTQEALHAFLHYDPETGVFTHRTTNRNARAGAVAGSQKNTGYIVVGVLGHDVLGHRLAWFYVHGVWPAVQVDHINRVRSDNRIDNLRLATQVENLQNTTVGKGNTSGHKGVHAYQGKWVAQISHNKKRHYLGFFADVEDAARAYAEAADRLHKFNTVSAAAQ